jgi:CRP-like cAMP-binding protein
MPSACRSCAKKLGFVASLLVDESEDAGGPVRLPQATLAQLLGATRPAVNRVLRGMEAEGLIRLGYREIEVADTQGLERIAAS